MTKLPYQLSIFGLGFLVNRYWRCPLRDVRLEILRQLFTEFCTTFPDHPHDENTEIWLLYSHHENSSQEHSYSILWTCDHFENNGDEDIEKLAVFMRHLAALTSNRCCFLALLDGNSERLVLELFDALPEIADHIKAHGKEGSHEELGSA